MKRPAYAQCSGPHWEKQRMRCFVRDDFTCQYHQLKGEECDEDRPRLLHCHHIKARINGGTHDLDNLLTVCRKHHEDIHPFMKKILSEGPGKVLDGGPMREL